MYTHLTVSLVLAISMVGISYGAGGNLPGNGLSESTAYLIEDLTDFDVFADQANAATYWSSGVYTKLTCDIDLVGRPYTTAVIAPDTDSSSSSFQGTPFSGVFDGNGHIVRNLTIDTAGAGNDYLGLFGRIEDSSAQVKNLGIENINIIGGNSSYLPGGLCGYNDEGTITNCYATGSVTGYKWLGGLCGYNDEGTITNCYATGSVTGGNESDYLGGLCGKNSGTIANCCAAGSVTGGDDSDYLGGLCGENRYGTINNCYATGSVTNGDHSDCLGGLCGCNRSTITNCYATGSVTGGDYSYYLGGLCGKNFGTITNGLWDTQSSGISVSDGGTGKTTAEMQTQSTFTDTGWDFTSESANGTNQIWQMPTGGGYPALSNFNGYTPVLLSGDGTEANPYLINDTMELGAIYHYNNNACFRLQSDIDLTGIQWSIAIVPAFSGCFDGNDYVIYNINIEGGNYLGLFGKISGADAQVKNLGLENVNITGGDSSCYLGGLCGYNYEGTITNCYATGLVTSGGGDLGGLCGCNYEGTITDCYATASVTGGYYSCYLGGLCGYNEEGTIGNCYAIGSVTGGDYSNCLGSLCGRNGYNSPITNCCATGSVTGGNYSSNLGGLCGCSYAGPIGSCYATGSVTGGDYSNCLGGLCGSNEGTIGNCYATGSVTGGEDSDNLGGLCGKNTYGTITNCYAAGLVTGGEDFDNLGGLCGYDYNGTITNGYFYLLSGPDNGLGTALDDLQMQDATSFDGFDFAGNSNDGEDDYWTIVSGHCPKLTWQTDDGPLVSPPVTTLSGSGYSYNPFQINSYADFTEFHTNSSLRCGYYILTVDIDLSGETFTTAVIGCFGGHFDGNDHTISNITIDTAGADNNCLGLFSKFYHASASDLGIENINITGGVDSEYLGGLCGKNWYGTITNCHANSSVTGGNYLGGLCGRNDECTITDCYTTGLVNSGAYSDYIGGLCGYNHNGTVSNCYAAGSITSWDYSDYLGGLCGYNYNGTISNCYAAGSVTGGYDSDYLGGLCGYNRGTITNCYATGSVTGKNYSNCLGGLCGHNYYGTISKCYATGSVTGRDDSGGLGGLCGNNRDSTISNCYAAGSVTGRDDSFSLGGLCGYSATGTITNCYATGSVTGDDDLGGLCGENYHGSFSNSFWNMETSGQTRSDGGFGRTTSQMKQSSTYNGWGDDIWTIEQGVDYPHLTWEGVGGTVVDNIQQRSYSGSGTETMPFVITTAADLCCLTGRQEDWDKCFEVANDINMSAITDYLPPGNFTGKFNGNGFRIFNFTVNEPDSSMLGLFGYLGYNSEINDLGLVDAEIIGYRYIGCLFGINNFKSTITNCYAAGSVIGDDYLGGLCGYNWFGTITNCYATSSVTGGYGSYYIGGLCGLNWNGTITNSFWDVETSGMSVSDGGTGKTTEQMQTESTFTDANWDFSVVPLWHMPFEAIGYPMLGWQKDIPGDFTGRYGVYMDDFAVLSDAWLSDDTPTANWNEDCDLDTSGVIDPVDLIIFAEHWLLP